MILTDFLKGRKWARDRAAYCEAHHAFLDTGVRYDDKTRLEGYNCIYGNTSIVGSEIGLMSFIGRGSNMEHVKMGRFSSASWDVEVLAGDHPLYMVSMHPAFNSNRNFAGMQLRQDNIYEPYRYAEKDFYVVIGNDVLISPHVRLGQGITIGDGAMITAGSVVTKDVPPYAIMRGNPAMPVAYRFRQKDIDFLLAFRWWDRDLEWIKAHVDDFQDVRRLRKLAEAEQAGQAENTPDAAAPKE